MDERRAQEILHSCITKNKALACDSGLTHGVWIRWAPAHGIDNIQLRGQLTLKEMKALTWWVIAYADYNKRKLPSNLYKRTTPEVRQLVIQAFNPEDPRWLVTCQKALIGTVNSYQLPTTATIKAILIDAGFQIPPVPRSTKKVPSDE